jgi:mannose-6-phosphate isomerase-like protein (cupin superfamily)
MPVLRSEQTRTIEAHGLRARPLVVPSRGSTELAMWQLTMPPGAPGVPHTVDKEEVFLVESGQLAGVLDGEEVQLGPGDALVVPPGVLFNVGNPGPTPTELLVCTSAGVRATLDGQIIEPVWAQ